MSESLVDQHPRIIEWNAKRQGIDDAERASRERVEAVMTPYHEGYERWLREATEAVEGGMEPPPEPERPHVSPADDRAAHTFLMKRRELDDERKRILAEIADEIEDAAEAVIRDVLAKAKASAKAIVGHTDHLQSVLRTLAQVRREDLVRIDAGDVVEASLGHRPLVAPPAAPHGPVDPLRRGLIENASAEGYGETQPAVQDGFVRR